jgi:hypothetical protein
VDELAAWLRRQAEQDFAQARDLIESEAAAPEWSEPASGVLYTGPPTADDAWAGTFAIGDSRITRFIAGHDPRTEIARAQSVLLTLDEHAEAGVSTYGIPECRACLEKGWRPGPCGDDGTPNAAWPCRTVRLLAFGYRCRDGYKAEEWKP